MNNPNSLSAENLLALAQWLDSQDTSHNIVDFNVTQNAYAQNHHMRIKPDDIYKYLGMTVDLNTCYVADHVTNKERVLAVLMLRSAILAGDSFV